MQEHSHHPDDVRARIKSPPGHGNLRDFVYGSIDGSITTFAIVAGVAGAGLSPGIIVVLGLANVLADGFSMAAGNYSATKSDLDNRRRLHRVEEHHIDTYPEGERLETREILAGLGLSGEVLDAATQQITSDRTAWIRIMLEGEYGLGSKPPDPLRAAFVTFGAFLLAGIIPLLPFVFQMDSAFAVSAWLTAGVFFAIGAMKSVWSLAPWWRSGLETLLIGGTAATVAYVIGAMFQA